MINRRRRIRAHIHDKPLPKGIRVFAWVRAIRWVGWGFGEALLPVFILMFSKTFAEMGFLSSTVDIASLMSLPIIGAWADRMPAKRLVVWSLLLYPLVGISYFLAGALGAAMFIVIARIVNGVTWELENVGIETYYRRIVGRGQIASSFGYIETWSHIAWIGASLVGMFLVLFMPIHYLLLAIAPFALISYFVLKRAPDDPVKSTEKKASFFSSYGRALGEWRTWNRHLWLLSLLTVFSSIVSALMYFFIPIDAYLTGANLPMVVLITIFGAIPALFGYKLGKLTDPRNKYRIISLGLFGVAAIALGLAVFPQYAFKLVAIFLMGIILELFYVAESSLITTLGPAATYGERGSAFESITVLSDLVAPLILGVGLDLIGFSNLAYVIAAAAVVLIVIYKPARK